MSFGRSKQASENLSLQEQQRRLQEQRAKEEEERRKKIDAVFGGGDASAGFWDSLETGKGGSRATSQPPPPPLDNDDEDILAAFSASVPVDNSSHYPPPSQVSNSSYSTPRSGTPRNGMAPSSGSHLQDLMGSTSSSYKSTEPIDPFDIENLPSRDTPTPTTTNNNNNTVDDDFDILGDLAKPVSELPPRPDPTPPPKPQIVEPPRSADPRDPVIAEIMDMGFTAAQARKALVETDSLDVNRAVGWLLEEAHRKSQPASSQPISRSVSEQSQRGRRNDEGGRRREEGREDSSVPAWARDRSRESGGEKDIGALAQEIGGTLFKSANSLWNTGRKKVEKAIAEFQTEGSGGEGGDPNMPKWMRDQQLEANTIPSRARETGDRPSRNRFDDEDMRPAPRAAQRAQKAAPEPALTEEAMMLEAGSGPPPRRKQERERERESSSPFPRSPSAMSEKEMVQRQRQLAFEQAIRDKERELRERERRQQSSSIPNSSERNKKLMREAVEEDSSVQYVSRNRRRPPPPNVPSNSKPAAPGPPQGDLLFGGGSVREQSRNPFHPQQQQQQQQQPQQPATRRSPAPTPTPPPAPRRTIPPRAAVPLSSAAANTSTASRKEGTEAFKRGDYTLALTHYTSALSPIPDAHPLRIIILSNRALCNLKLGDPRSALSDCESALTIIGPARGEGETIAIDGANKDMKDFWAKTITRKAEGLEQLEKWADAAAIWTIAVEAGVGGAVAAAGRRRCEAALKPKAPPKPKPKAPVRRPAAAAKTMGDATAVRALRQANAAADRVEDEKLALHDSVEARIGAWKAGKEGNLRALLGSLDVVLWEGAGWKKVGMGELLMPNKCKVAYMKGIAKVHPDKVCGASGILGSFFYFLYSS